MTTNDHKRWIVGEGVSIYIYIHTCIHVYIPKSHKYVCSLLHMHIYPCIYLYVSLYVYLHTYIHTYIHTWAYLSKWTGTNRGAQASPGRPAPPLPEVDGWSRPPPPSRCSILGQREPLNMHVCMRTVCLYI